MERACILCEGRLITRDDLPARMVRTGTEHPEIVPVSGGVNLDSLLKNIEKHYIISALRKSRGNRTKAANLLGLKRTTLLARMKALNLTEGRGGGNDS